MVEEEQKEEGEERRLETRRYVAQVVGAAPAIGQTILGFVADIRGGDEETS